MQITKVALAPLTREYREKFIIANQQAFKFGAMEEFGLLDDHIDDDGEIISRKTIETCIDDEQNKSFCIMLDNKFVGGVIVKIDRQTQHNHLEILFVDPSCHSKGIGFGAWKEVEKLFADTKVWETCTPYFDKRNIHFYINKCGFCAVEFFGKHHVDPNCSFEDNAEGPDEMFRFVKRMNG